MMVRNLFFFLVMVSLLAACSSNDKPSYPANTIQTSMLGTIEHIEVVKVDGKSSWIGSTIGSVAGGVLGSTIGNGWGRVATSIVGSVAGGLAGGGAERQLTKGEGVKMSIRRDDGSDFVAIVVPDENQSFSVGDKVRVISNSNGAVRVIQQ